MTYSITWDLDSIFPNGSESKELSQRMTQLTEQTKEYHQLITEWTPESAQGKEQFAEILTLQGKISNGFSQCNSFLTALTGYLHTHALQIYDINTHKGNTYYPAEAYFFFPTLMLHSYTCNSIMPLLI